MSATVQAPAVQEPRVGWRARLAAGPDLWLARLLLLAALVFAGAQDVDHSLNGGLYGPLDEFWHTAYVQKVADSGTPPVYGKDVVRLGPLGRPAESANVTVIRGVDILPGQPTLFPSGMLQPQNEAIQPPLYYYLVAPVAKAVPWSDRVPALRLTSSLLALLAIPLLFLAVRLAVPGNPLAAGLAAVVLGTMTGVNSTMSQVQNTSLLTALSALVLLLFVRAVQRREVGWALPVAASLMPVTQVVSAPAAGLAVATALAVTLWERRPPRREAVRLVVTRGGVFLAPVVLWIAWNLSTYGHYTPVDLSGQGPASEPTLGIFRIAFELVPRAVWTSFNGFYTSFFPGAGRVDIRAAGVTVIALALGLVAAGLSGGLRGARRPLGLFLGYGFVVWLTVYAMIIVSTFLTGGFADFVGRYFVGAAIAFAAVVGVGTTAALYRVPWLVRSGAVAASLLLLGLGLQVTFPGVVP